MAGSRVAGTPTQSRSGSHTGSRSESPVDRVVSARYPTRRGPHARRKASARSMPSGRRTGPCGRAVAAYSSARVYQTGVHSGGTPRPARPSCPYRIMTKWDEMPSQVEGGGEGLGVPHAVAVDDADVGEGSAVVDVDESCHGRRPILEPSAPTALSAPLTLGADGCPAIVSPIPTRVSMLCSRYDGRTGRRPYRRVMQRGERAW